MEKTPPVRGISGLVGPDQTSVDRDGQPAPSATIASVLHTIMRKRKPPILPVTLLVALLAVVAYTNYQNSPLTKKEREQAPKVAESRPTEDKSAVSERLKASVDKDAPEDAPKPISDNPLAPIAGPGSIPNGFTAARGRRSSCRGARRREIGRASCRERV